MMTYHSIAEGNDTKKFENHCHMMCSTYIFHLKTVKQPTKILKDFLSRLVFWATEEEMERMCLSKVNFLSNIIPRILKNSQEFREVLPTKRSGWGGNTVLDLLTIILWVLLGFSLMPHKSTNESWHPQYIAYQLSVGPGFISIGYEG